MPRPKNYRDNPYYSNPANQRPNLPFPYQPPPRPGGGSAITVYKPTAISPYSPPGALTKFRPPRIPKPSFGLGNAVAGSFRAAAGGGSAVRGGAGLVGRRIPWIALGFITFDAFVLACAAGILPSNICPRPDNPQPGGKDGGFSGGQCNALIYRVFFRYHLTIGGTVWYDGNNTAYGPIQGVSTTFTVGNSFVNYIVGRGSPSAGLYPPGYKSIAQSGGLSAGHGIYNIEVVSVVLESGGIDNCGNPPPIPVSRNPPDIYQNINNHNNNINKNIYISNPTSPSPKPNKAPIIISPPFPIPDINLNYGGNYYQDNDEDLDLNIDYRFSPGAIGNFSDFPDFFNNSPPSPQPRSKDPNPIVFVENPPGSTPSLNNVPEIPPPIPDKLPEDSTESDKYQFRQNKEVLDKLYKVNEEISDIQNSLEKHGKILSNIQSLVDFEIEGSQLITRCDNIDIFYTYKEKVLRAINKQLDQVKIIEQAIIKEVCDLEIDAIAAIPEWWERRLQSDIPQISLVFRSVGTRTYYKLNIPHPFNTNKLVNAPIEGYKKGNWQAQIICLDNSKFIVNCETKEEAERVGNLALTLIDPQYAGLNPKLYFAERRGEPVQDGIMLATSAMFFPTGQKNTVPEWRVTFTMDGK